MTIGRLATLFAVLALSAPAHAQSAEAEVLFREGKKLLKDGKIVEACYKLDASERLDSSVGTLLNLADCREKNHQLATAWALFRKAATAAKVARDPKRQSEARRRGKLLEPRLSYLTIAVADAGRMDGLAIARNGDVVDPALWNQSVPVDPGEYEVVCQAPGRERWSKRIELAGEAETATIEVPRLEPPKPRSPAAPAVKPAMVKLAAESTREEPPPRVDDDPRPTTFTPKRKLALALAAVGATGIASGVVLGLHARDLENQSDALCPTSICNDPHALQLNSSARSTGLYANIGYVAGGAAIVGSVVLWFVGTPRVAHEDVAVTAVVTRDHVGLSFARRF